jgi:hypothetical protein
MHLRSADGSVTTTSRGNAFVDDAGLGCTATPAADIPMARRSTVAIVSNLQALAQQWERLLFSTGGALNLQKCFWYIVSWKWKGSKPSLETALDLPASLC